MDLASEVVLPTPDDWHLHLRDGPLVLQHTVKAAARQFGRAIIMPNLVPPVLNADDAASAFLAAAADAAAAPPAATSSHFTRVAPPLLETALLVPVNGVSSRFGP